jgi:hypothetical protein
VRLCACLRCLTLPLSGRQGTWGGEAGCSWWPVHSRGLFEVSPLHRESLQFVAADAEFMQVKPSHQLLPHTWQINMVMSPNAKLTSRIMTKGGLRSRVSVEKKAQQKPSLPCDLRHPLGTTNFTQGPCKKGIIPLGFLNPGLLIANHLIRVL